MGEYKKTTKDDIILPKYCHYFISEIIDSLDEYNIKDPGDELTLEIETSQHPYCYDALELVVRTFKRKRYDTKIPSFHIENKDGKKTYMYKWKLIKLSDIDDLPF